MTIAAIQKLFREKRLKVTPQRCAIYNMMIHTQSHPTAEEIISHVKQALPMISLNTVYYTLNVFETAGLIMSINNTHTRYDTNLEPHHHLIWVSCRKIEDVFDDALNQLHLSQKSDFEIRGYRVEFYGHCLNCQKPGTSIRRNKRLAITHL